MINYVATLHAKLSFFTFQFTLFTINYQ